MSVTISAVPFFLLYTIGGSILTEIGNSVKRGAVFAETSEKLHLTDDFAQELFSKEYKTEIMDKDTLIKTLDEHGATNIQEYGNKISCDCEGFHIELNKKNVNTPYILTLNYNEDKGINDFVDNISSEYSINVQEASYNKIKERLAEKNLTIESEEIYDDNSIVLTVNLE